VSVVRTYYIRGMMYSGRWQTSWVLQWCAFLLFLTKGDLCPVEVSSCVALIWIINWNIHWTK
jgi:hypothetical protein